MEETKLLISRDQLREALRQWEKESRQPGALSREDVLKLTVDQVADMNTSYLYPALGGRE